MKISQKLNYFTRAEKLLWIVSVLCIVISFMCFDRANYMTLIASVSYTHLTLPTILLV